MDTNLLFSKYNKIKCERKRIKYKKRKGQDNKV